MFSHNPIHQRQLPGRIGSVHRGARESLFSVIPFLGVFFGGLYLHDDREKHSNFFALLLAAKKKVNDRCSECSFGFFFLWI